MNTHTLLPGAFERAAGGATGKRTSGGRAAGISRSCRTAVFRDGGGWGWVAVNIWLILCWTAGTHYIVVGPNKGEGVQKAWLDV